MLWPVLLLAGVEQVVIAPGDTAFTPLNFVHYPWTHSLAAAIVWSFFFALICYRYFGKKPSIILGLLVFSHWLLDFLTHRPDLLLWPGSATKLGLGLWHSVAATLIIESALFAVGVWLYVRSTPSRDRIGTWAFWGLIGFLGLVYLANAFGPPPPSVHAIALAGIAGAALFTAWAWWADRHRGAPADEKRLARRDWLYALATLVLAGAFAWWGTSQILPLAAEAIARRVPQEAEATIGDRALEAPEGKGCTTSRLQPRMQTLLAAEFARLTAGLADGYRYRLLVRHCPDLGPNAFAVPGGAIVLTDQLVNQARNFPELMGPLAHEIGHVRHRHGLRTLLRDAHPMVLARTLASDYAALGDFAATLPATLLRGGYSRAFEDEADAFALERLRKLGISPRGYADLLDRMVSQRTDKGAAAARDYFAAHPLEARITRALAAETEVDRCTYSSNSREERLEACNRAIDAGKASGTELASAYTMRGQLLNASGAQERAIEDIGRALSLGSREPQAYNTLAWILATSPEDRLRDGARAKQLALVACELSEWKEPSIIDTLAAAHAERAEFSEAVRRQKEALGFPEFERAQGKQGRERLALYEAGRPHREDPRTAR